MGKGKIKQSSPKVTVVLLCHNSGKKLKETINNQAKTDYPNFEIVIVDNNSEGETKEVLAELEATYTIIHNKKNLGYAGGMNEGIRFGLKLKSKYIGIVTEDMQVHKDWLKDGVEILERNEKNGMAGLNVNPKAIDEFNYMGAGQFGVQAIWEKIIGQKYPKAYFETEQQLVGSILLIKSDLFYKVGLFDDGFFLYCEE
ncbi:MAG: glycosyltransferase family 2 protein, partial [Candidatus Diapherotrites archaeon]|nr:glycosyltransferase family 2 protein [Candidatus Diapherotrites archaeon]